MRKGQQSWRQASRQRYEAKRERFGVAFWPRLCGKEAMSSSSKLVKLSWPKLFLNPINQV